jgi:hypothetical protein
LFHTRRNTGRPLVTGFGRSRSVISGLSRGFSTCCLRFKLLKCLSRAYFCLCRTVFYLRGIEYMRDGEHVAEHHSELELVLFHTSRRTAMHDVEYMRNVEHVPSELWLSNIGAGKADAPHYGRHNGHVSGATSRSR